MNILEKITERTKERIEEEKKIVPLEEVRRQAEEKGIKDKYIFMIGGAPVSEELKIKSLHSNRHFGQKDCLLSARQKKRLHPKD